MMDPDFRALFKLDGRLNRAMEIAHYNYRKSGGVPGSPAALAWVARYEDHGQWFEQVWCKAEQAWNDAGGDDDLWPSFLIARARVFAADPVGRARRRDVVASRQRVGAMIREALAEAGVPAPTH